MVAEYDSRIVGFLSAYNPPNDGKILFIWQVAVHSSQREKGLASIMIREVLRRPACADIEFIETTVSPKNKPSRKLFKSFADKMGAQCEEKTAFQKNLFLPDRHDDEVLFRIGPVKGFKNSFQKYRSNFPAVVKEK